MLKSYAGIYDLSLKSTLDNNLVNFSLNGHIIQECTRECTLECTIDSDCSENAYCDDSNSCLCSAGWVDDGASGCKMFTGKPNDQIKPVVRIKNTLCTFRKFPVRRKL